jgi:SPP1 family phage portal protein
MKVLEITGKKESQNDVISVLKSRRITPAPDVKKSLQAIDPSKHKINDEVYRPNKRIKVDKDEIDATRDAVAEGYRVEKVARIKLALQKLIIKRAVAFLFGNPVSFSAEPENENQELILRAMKRIFQDVKSNSLNRKIARAVFGFNECAELWFPVEKDVSNYGFKSKYKLRCALFSPAFGDALYPYFDDTGDMVAFSREFKRKDTTDKETTYFETYTADEHWMWKSEQAGFVVVEGFPKQIAIGKIPVVYACQEETETQDVDSLIDRLELLLSNFADTNDYHAAPKIFIKGELKGFSKKGESGAIIEGEEESDAKYLSWQNAPESVKLEIETLLRMIYTITQTPDISFESVKGIGAVSGIALKLLFMDAHLKVQDKREIFDEYLQRRVNVVKAFIAQFNTKLDADSRELEIEPEITPYMLTSELDEINYWITANGNKPIISQRQSVKNAGLTNDPDADFEQIQEEASRDNTFTLGEPTFDA